MTAREASSLYQQQAVFSTGLHWSETRGLGNHRLMQEVSVLIDGAMIDGEALTPCAH